MAKPKKNTSKSTKNADNNITRVKAKDSSPKKTKTPKVAAKKTIKPNKSTTVKATSVTTKKSKKKLPKFIAAPLSIIGKIIGFILKPVSKPLGKLGKYLKSSWQELKLVRWTTRRETWKMTGSVIVFTIAFFALIAGLDIFFNWVFKLILNN